MSILGAESYAAVCHLVTDVEVLSREERNHVLWYACDGGDLSMVKSVIKAVCDVDHFHRSHTPLMMASIGDHEDVVKELIFAGCKVNLWSSKCSVSWFRFITKMASAWLPVLVWAVALVFMMVAKNAWVECVCYWLIVLTIAYHFLSDEDSFQESRMLRMNASSRYMIWTALIVSAMVCVWCDVGTAALQDQSLAVLVLVVIVTVLMAVTGVLTVVKKVARTVVGTVAVVYGVTAVVAVCVTVIGIWIAGESGAEEETMSYVFIGPSMAGKAVTVANMAVTLTVAMAAAGAVPFAVAAIVTGSVTMAGIGGAALQDTVLKSADVPIALMLPVIVLLAWTPTGGAIIRMSTSSISGMTALHYAAWYDHITCGTHLVEAGANMQVENMYVRTPLHICSHEFKVAMLQMQLHPPKQAITVIGNTECGKSTLIAALQSESRTPFQSLVYKLTQVYNITQRTAGIETVSFSSAKYGHILFYDFAGQSDYHGPHQHFLEAMLSKPGMTVTMLLLVKVTEGQDVITQQLIRWLQPVALASTPSTPHVIVVGSFLDQARSEEAHQKLQGCIDSVQKEYPSLKVHRHFLLDCREPDGAYIQGLHHYLQQTLPLIRLASSAMFYNIRWVMAQLQKTFCEQSIQLSTFREWLQDNTQNLPSHLPSPENICHDLSAVGYILFLHNKQDLSQSWLVLDLQTILHNVYGTLFSPSRAVVNQFGLLHCSLLSKLFPTLDPRMIQEVLITLEFCIRVDPLLLKEEMFSLTEQDGVEGWLYFPALVSAKACDVFTPDPQCLHWACWQLKTDDNHIISAHLLQGIVLGVAATHVFIEKELPHSVRKHCCSVWVNGLSWASTKGVDVAVQISDSSTIQVIGRSKEGPAELHRYMSSVTQSIFKTIAKLSPALKATPYIIHPYTYVGLDESRSAPRTTPYPVASIVRSIEAGHKYVHSLPISSGSGSDTASLNKLFGGWSPSFVVVQCLKETQTNSFPLGPSPLSHDIDSKPTLRDLELVVRQAASKWDLLARSLGVRESLIGIVKRNLYYDCEEACREVLKRWLSGDHNTGDAEKNWRSIMTALEEIGEKLTD